MGIYGREKAEDLRVPTSRTHARPELTSDSNLHLGLADLDRKVGLTDRGSGLSAGSGRGRM